MTLIVTCFLMPRLKRWPICRLNGQIPTELEIQLGAMLHPGFQTSNVLDTRIIHPIEPASINKRADRGQGKSGTSEISGPEVYSPFSLYASASFTNSIGHVWGS